METPHEQADPQTDQPEAAPTPGTETRTSETGNAEHPAWPPGLTNAQPLAPAATPADAALGPSDSNPWPSFTSDDQPAEAQADQQATELERAVLELVQRSDYRPVKPPVIAKRLGIPR